MYQCGHGPCAHEDVEVERYLKDFVFSHTGEECELHLVRDIQVRHCSTQGNTLLAILWANVLQHERNYPQNKHTYSQAYDEATHADVLIVPIDNIQLMVYMGSGMLRITGQYVYEWFTKHFKDLLDNFSPVFAGRWEDPLNPQAQMEVTNQKTARPGRGCEQKKERKIAKEHRAATEDYLLLLTDRHIYNKGHEKKIMHDAKNIEFELMRMSKSQNIWCGDDLSHQVSCVSHGGVRDGYNYVYKLWRSLLHAWFSDQSTRVFICSPSLDERCLADILDLYIPHYTTAEIVSIFTQRRCSSGGSEQFDSNRDKSFFQMKRKLLQKYPERVHSVIEYKIYRSLLYPSAKFNCRFLAGVSAGVAKVMTTSADFNMEHFVSGNMESVSVRGIGEPEFMADYVTPLTAHAIAMD